MVSLIAILGNQLASYPGVQGEAQRKRMPGTLCFHLYFVTSLTSGLFTSTNSEEHLQASNMNWSITIAIFSVDINFSFLN